MKKYKILLILTVLSALAISAAIFWRNKKMSGEDYRIGVFADDGMALISISESRKMVNVLKISPEAKIWIPGGMGWYRSEVVRKLLATEGKDLYPGVLFYNFGFVADKMVFLKKTDDWQQKFWLKIKLSDLIVKDEFLNEDSDVDSDLLDKIMLRDFSESKVFNEDLKISVVNTGQEDGLAGFISKNMERMGFSVVSVMSDENSETERCVVLYGDEVEETYSWFLLENIFTDCQKTKDSSLNMGEIEFYFGNEFAFLIKYPSYKNK